MAVTVNDVVREVEMIAPKSLAADWDNVGLLIGDGEVPVQRAAVTLDVSRATIREAVKAGASLIVSHHPMIYKPVSLIRADDPTGFKIMELIRNGISLIAAHTNYDAAPGGTNDTLCDLLGLSGVSQIIRDGGGFMGRTGNLPEETTAGKLAKQLKELLACVDIRLYGDKDAVISGIAVCAGGGSKPEYIKEAFDAGYKCYVTGDTRYHDVRYAEELGVTLIDATHRATELPGVRKLAERLNEAFAGMFQVM